MELDTTGGYYEICAVISCIIRSIKYFVDQRILSRSENIWYVVLVCITKNHPRSHIRIKKIVSFNNHNQHVTYSNTSIYSTIIL